MWWYNFTILNFRPKFTACYPRAFTRIQRRVVVKTLHRTWTLLAFFSIRSLLSIYSFAWVSAGWLCCWSRQEDVMWKRSPHYINIWCNRARVVPRTTTLSFDCRVLKHSRHQRSLLRGVKRGDNVQLSGRESKRLLPQGLLTIFRSLSYWMLLKP